MLEIELTESSVLENLARVQDELDRLKALGAVLTLDDFGTAIRASRIWSISPGTS